MSADYLTGFAAAFNTRFNFHIDLFQLLANPGALLSLLVSRILMQSDYLVRKVIRPRLPS